MGKYTQIIKDSPKLAFRYTKGETDIFYNKQFHPNYEIYLFIDGCAEFLSDNTRKPLNPYELIIIPPGLYHCFLTDKQHIDTYERFVINIDTDFLGNSILEEAFTNKRFLKLTSDHRIVQNFMYLKNHIGDYSEKDAHLVLTAVVTDIIFLIKQCEFSLESKTVGTLRPISIEIINFINKNYKSNLSVSGIANAFSFSVSSLSHIFKEDFGVSIKKYITEKRMNEIYLLLQKGERPTVVSADFGFSNYSTFYRSFCNYFGKSPSEIKPGSSNINILI